MNRNSNRRIHPIAEADGLSPKKHRKREISLKKAVFRPLRQQPLNCQRNITIRTALARVNAVCRRCRVRR